jgi:cell wall-associated NlpC family hydrolase
MTDWSEYIGIPYKFGGSDRNGVDCWGLVRLVYRERYGRELPAFEHNGLTEEECGLLVDHSKPLMNARRLDWPRLGDLVVMKIYGHPCHVGIVVGGPGERNLLHTLKGHDSVIDRYDGPTWQCRLDGFYRV